MDLVSVIIPYYNKKKFINKTINSAINQSYKHIEIIVVYDDENIDDLKFINEIKQEFKLSNNQICLSGFSQGCMMSLNVGLTLEDKFLCIVGFSGKIINQKDLKNRIKNNTETLLIHGEADQIVPSTHLLEAKDFLIRNNIKVDTLLIKNCDHHIPIEASSTALNFILKKI